MQLNTTQDTRALIARLQARLGAGTQGEAELWLGVGALHRKQVVLLNDYRIAGPGHGGTVSMIARWDVRIENVLDAIKPLSPQVQALAELPAQIARWLARLDEADRLRVESKAFAGYRWQYEALERTVTEDVQAWAVRLGVGDA